MVCIDNRNLRRGNKRRDEEIVAEGRVVDKTSRHSHVGIHLIPYL